MAGLSDLLAARLIRPVLRSDSLSVTDAHVGMILMDASAVALATHTLASGVSIGAEFTFCRKDADALRVAMPVGTTLYDSSGAYSYLETSNFLLPLTIRKVSATEYAVVSKQGTWTGA